MVSNILVAIKNLIENPACELSSKYLGRNRVNSTGDALEKYVKDLFANTLFNVDEYEKIKIYNEVFSYVGNQNNPPDIILKNGDAIEVKKIQGKATTLALNSSYPKDKLSSNSLMITNSCKACEEWKEKDLLYVIGNTDDKLLRELWFVYGDCYVADKKIYERMKKIIVEGLHSVPNIELAKTNELGKIKKVDPLGITDLRVRGMWSIYHPRKVFSYIPKQDRNSKLKFYCIIKEEKFLSFPKEDRDNLLKLVDDKQFFIKNLSIKNPNNPAELIGIKFMEFYYE